MIIIVSIDYRLKSNVTQAQVFELLNEIGYHYVGKKKKCLKKGNAWSEGEEFIRPLKEGRFHIFLEFSRKHSGSSSPPQVDIHAHYDHYRTKGEKKIHVTRRNFNKANIIKVPWKKSVQETALYPPRNV